AFAGQHEVDRLGIDSMLFFQNACRERLPCVIVLDGNHRLQNDRSTIESIVHKVYRASAEFDAVLQRFLLRIHTRKRWKQRRMDMQDIVRIRIEERAAKDTHKARQYDETDIGFFQ